MYRNIPQSLTSVFHIKYSSQTCDLRLSRMNWGFRVFAYHPFYSKSKSLSVILTNAETAPTPVACHVNKLTARALVPYGQYKNRLLRRDVVWINYIMTVMFLQPWGQEDWLYPPSDFCMFMEYELRSQSHLSWLSSFFFIARICMVATS